MTEAILERLPVTIELTFAAMLISLLIALPAGIISATRRNSLSDLISTTAALLGASMPNFFLAILLIFIFSLRLRWLPPWVLPDPHRPDGQPARHHPARHHARLCGRRDCFRLTRSSLLEVLHQDYIRTARAKGVRERRVIYLHALRTR